MYDPKNTTSPPGLKRGAEKQTSWENPAAWVAANLKFQPDDKQKLVLSTRSKRGIINCTRQWGKSYVGAAKAVHQACSQPNSLTLVVTPSGRQSGLLLKQVKQHARTLGIKARGDGDNEISMLFPNGSRVVGLPGDEGTIRGFSAVSLVLIDEASRVSDDMYVAVRPMLATSGGSLWMMSTPNGKRGFFYDAWANGGDSWERISVPATECSRIPKEHLEDERRNMSERNFLQEYMCQFSTMEDGLFDRDMLEAAISHDFAPLVL